MNMQEKLIAFVQYQLPVIAWSVFIFIASSIPSANIAMLPNYTDKVVHASVFLILCWLMHVALSFQKNLLLKKHALLIAVVFVAVYGVSDEYHQMFTPGRSTDPLDLAADTFGGLVYALIYLRFQFYRNG
ncbi:MAG: VanZ family protein [Bacteroidota bacterium]